MNGRAKQYWIEGLVLALLVSLFANWAFARACFFALVLSGLWWLIRGQVQRPFSREQRLIAWACAGYFLAGLISFVVNEFPDRGARLLSDRYILLLGFLPLVAAFRVAKLRQAVIWWGFMLGAISVGVIALVDVFYLHTGRAQGFSNPIHFGATSLAIAMIAAYAFDYVKTQAKWVWCCYAAAITLGVTAAILSYSRGVWLAMPVALLMPAAYAVRHWRWRVRFAVLGVLVLALIGFINVPVVSERIERAVREYQTFEIQSAEGQVLVPSSIGWRLAMWQIAWKQFLSAPVFGVGTGNYKNVIPELGLDQTYARVTEQKQPHNQYLAALSMRGVVGGLSLLLILAVPAYQFYRRWRAAPELGMLCFAGMTLALNYAVYSLTEVPLEQRVQIMFYAFAMALLAFAVNRGDPVKS